MLQFNNLTILGSSHIAKQSINEVERAFEEIKPSIVCLELDANRYMALMNKKKRASKFSIMINFGITAFVFAILGEFVQNKLGDIVGISPGAEMKTAIKLAKKNKSKIVFIDQPIEVTLKKLSEKMTLIERLRFIYDLSFGWIFSKEKVNFNLNEVPSEEIIQKLVHQLKHRYPVIYTVLIKERNVIMASNLLNLMNLYPNDSILAIMGAGHVADSFSIIKDKFSNISYSFSIS
ncbi:TraB/GumN family protein [Candidatus Woesearchaeota archaeon]|nr:TraB/GumN family protein [Candidatus Woesearchaeota archaeon]